MTRDKKIVLNNIEILIKYKKIKNINLKVKQNLEVVLSVPIRIKDIEIENFLNSRIDWIQKALKKFENSKESGFYFLGSEHKLVQIHENSRNLEVKIEGNEFRIYLHSGIPDKTKLRYLEKYLEKKLLDVTSEFFEKWEKTLGISKNSLIIKKMKGKWGYCHTKNHDICLNLELIKKDIKFIEYVVLHELCHILVPNHGPKFKNLLNKHMPEWKKVVKIYSI